MKIPPDISIGVCVNDPTVNLGTDFTVGKYAYALKRIARHGFDSIEYSHVAHLSEEQCREVGTITRELSMRPWSIHSEHLNAPDEAAIADYLRIQDICARNTAALGCEILVLHPPNADLSMSRKAEVVRQVAEIAARHRVKAALENIPTHTFEQLREMVDRAGHPNLGFTLDTGHARLMGPRGVLDAIRAFSGRIWTLHLQDNLGENDDHMPPGLGVIDWRKTLAALWDSGYDAPLLVELTVYGVKAHRAYPALRTLPLEVEQALAVQYLRFVHKVLREGETTDDDPVRNERYAGN